MFIVSKGICEYTDISCHHCRFDVQSLFIFLQGFSLHWRILKKNAVTLLYVTNIKCDMLCFHHNCTVQRPLILFKDAIRRNKLDTIQNNNNKQGFYRYTDDTDQNNIAIVWKQILKQPHGVPTGRQWLSHMVGIML